MGAESLIGMANPILDMMGNQMNLNNSEHMAGVQARHQTNMNLQGLQNSKNLWDYTNYENQVKHMKNAGLSVGLMYKGSGAGGTTSVASGGSAGMPTTPQLNLAGASAQGVQTATQAMMANANIDVAKAQADKLRAEAENLRGVDRTKTQTETQSIIQGIENQKAQEQLLKVQSDVGITGIEKAKQEIRSIGYQNQIDQETINEKIKILENEAVGGAIRNKLAEAQIMNTNQQTTESKERINKMAQDIAQGWANLRVNEKNARINEFKENLKAEYPNITQIPGKLWNDLMIEIDELFGSNIWKKQKSK